RLEFIGDTIESLRTYDPATQRSTAAIDQLTIVPLRDLLIAGLEPRATSDIAGLDSDVAQDFSPADLDRTATIFDYLALARDVRIILSERDEIVANLTKLVEQLQHSYEEVPPAAAAEREGAERPRGGVGPREHEIAPAAAAEREGAERPRGGG